MNFLHLKMYTFEKQFKEPDLMDWAGGVAGGFPSGALGPSNLKHYKYLNTHMDVSVYECTLGCVRVCIES